MEDLIDRQAAIDAASDGCSEWRGIFQRIKEKIEALPSEQPEQRWKLCKDHLPPRKGMYRVTFNDGTMGFCGYDEGCWWMVACFKWSKYDDIKAWYKPPEPYKEEQDV